MYTDVCIKMHTLQVYTCINKNIYIFDSPALHTCYHVTGVYFNRKNTAIVRLPLNSHKTPLVVHPTPRCNSPTIREFFAGKMQL